MSETRVVLGVRHHYDRRSLLIQLGEQLHNLGTVLGIQVTGWLIGQDNLRVGNYRTGDRHTLLLTSGELLREVSRTVADIHSFQDIRYHLFTLRRLDL